MKKTIFVTAALITAAVSFAQKKEKAPPPPPTVEMKELPPPPPPPPPPKVEISKVGNLPEDYQVFLDKNPEVEKLGWTHEHKVIVYLKSKEKEVYDLRQQDDAKKLESKYGTLPQAPPHPPLPPAPPKKVKKTSRS